jgi:hypothetical protein
MSDSMVRLLATTAEHLERKSLKEVKASLLLAGPDDLVDDVVPDVADRLQAEADVAADSREAAHRLVDVRREDLDAHPPALPQSRGRTCPCRRRRW